MKLGALIADYRYANNLGVREVAKEIGTSPATLSRIENGKPFDSDTMAKIMLWLFTGATPRPKRQKEDLKRPEPLNAEDAEAEFEAAAEAVEDISGEGCECAGVDDLEPMRRSKVP